MLSVAERPRKQKHGRWCSYERQASTARLPGLHHRGLGSHSFRRQKLFSRLVVRPACLPLDSDADRGAPVAQSGTPAAVVCLGAPSISREQQQQQRQIMLQLPRLLDVHT